MMDLLTKFIIWILRLHVELIIIMSCAEFYTIQNHHHLTHTWEKWLVVNLILPSDSEITHMRGSEQYQSLVEIENTLKMTWKGTCNEVFKCWRISIFGLISVYLLEMPEMFNKEFPIKILHKKSLLKLHHLSLPWVLAFCEWSCIDM